MPSGITHILLAKGIAGHINSNRKLKALLSGGAPFLIPGAVGPDLPYASIADGDLFFTDQSELADKLHYIKTNQPALLAFREIKKMNDSLTAAELKALFCFFTGYVTHIIADGIFHPFVRDMVGDYKLNQSAHRILELKLDVIYLWHLYGLNLNNTNIHDQLKDIRHFPYRYKIFNLYSKVISDVYGDYYPPETIAGWIDGLHTMFNVAEGHHPVIYKNLPGISSYLFKDIVDLQNEMESTCLLEKPVDRPDNFLHKESVHFLNECVPRFFEAAVPMVKKVYEYIYMEGPELTENDILPVDLDTGRDLAVNNDLNETPLYWRIV